LIIKDLLELGLEIILDAEDDVVLPLLLVLLQLLLTV
jgi:hypothetical protein